MPIPPSSISSKRGVRGAGGSTPLINRGDLFYEMGDLSRAGDSFRKALEIATSRNNRGDAAFANYELGRIALAQDKLPEARHLYEQSESVFKQIEDPDDAANTELALAELEIEEGSVPLAESTARQVVEYFKGQNNSSAQATAQAVLAEVLVEKGDAAGALTELAPQFKRQNNPNRIVNAQVAPVIARSLEHTSTRMQCAA